MRWYCVCCLAASRLKNSTLRLLRASVTLMLSSRTTSCSGAGRKSGTTLGSPIGSSVYLIFPVIDLLAFAPVTGADDPYYLVAEREPDAQYAFADLAEAEIARLIAAVCRVDRNDATSISEGKLGRRETPPCFL
jgi:hypothetical protein